MHPFYVIRALGGVCFLVGSLIMVWNVIMTVRSSAPEAQQPAAMPATV